MTKQAKKTILWTAGLGVAGGVFAIFIWPEIQKRLQQPGISVGIPTIAPKRPAYSFNVPQGSNGYIA